MFSVLPQIGVSAIASQGRANNERQRGKLLGLSILCAALLLGLAGRPAFAQTGTTRSHAEVRRLLVRLRLQAGIVAARSQAASQRLTQLKLITTPNFITQLMIDRLAAELAGSQSALGTIQQSINLVAQLNTDLVAANRLIVRIQVETRQLTQLQTSGMRTRLHQARITALQSAIQADQAALQTLEQQIATLQQQVAQLFG